MDSLLLSIFEDLFDHNFANLQEKTKEYLALSNLRINRLMFKPTFIENFENIPGLFFIHNFLSPSEITFIHNKLPSINFEPITLSTNSRRVAHFGYYYSYDRSCLEPAAPIPEYMKILLIPLKQNFDQMIINEYKPRQKITPHIDHPEQFGPIIACISIGQTVAIDFALGNVKKNIKVKSGSLYMMTADSRYKWKHGLTNSGPENRYSLTFRSVDLSVKVVKHKCSHS